MRGIQRWFPVLMATTIAHAEPNPNAVLEAAVRSGRVPGVVAMVATSEAVIYAKAAGFADRANHVPMRLDAIFRVASMTKPLTSVAVMQLLDDGQIRLDAPISDYLAEFEPRPVLLAVEDGEPRYTAATYAPTVRQLLSHSSGFAYSFWNDRLFAITDFSALAPDYFVDQPLAAEPGTEWQYGTGTDWAGLIVERVSGMSLENYFRRRITGPLGMADTSYNVPADKQARIVTRHQREADGTLTETPNEGFPPVTFFPGGAGLYSTAADYVAFMQMILRGGVKGERILSLEAVDAMAVNQIGELEVVEMKSTVPNFSNDFDIYPDTAARFGLGFLINEADVPGRRRRMSLTWGGLYNTYFWIDRQSDLCGVLLTQILPFYDHGVIELLAEFESAIYRQRGIR